MNAASEDVANRGPVWDALSALFLDTELEPSDFERLGRTLADSPYTLEELDAIFYDEVYPICISNLFNFFGEWAGFDSAWLRAEILKRQESRLRIPRWLRMGRWIVREPWRKLKDAFLRYRQETAG